MTIILFNVLDVEIARETVNFQSEISSVIADWQINDGDYIVFEGVAL